MKKVFSIVTITKDALPGLKRTFASLKSQSIKNFEWIVIDGASTDGTIDWLLGIDQPGFDMVWLSEVDEGISDAWNKGINRSSADQVLILNSGDTYDSNMIEILSNKISNNKITCTNARIIDPISQIQVGIFRAYPHKLSRGMHLPHNWCSVPIAFYKLYGGYPLIKYAMDFSWFHKYYKSFGVNGFNCIDEELGNYYLGGISDKNYIKSFAENRKILIENGCGNFLATYLFLIYVSRHYIKKLIDSFKLK